MGTFINRLTVEAQDALIVGSLPADHPAKKLAKRLPVRHPIRDLFDGEFQWIGQIKTVRACLHVFEAVYEDHLRSACDNGLLRTMAPLDQAAITREFLAFQDTFPDHVVFYGKRYRFSDLRARARRLIEDRTSAVPHQRAAALAAFDHAFARLVRAVRLS